MQKKYNLYLRYIRPKRHTYSCPNLDPKQKSNFKISWGLFYSRKSWNCCTFANLVSESRIPTFPFLTLSPLVQPTNPMGCRVATAKIRGVERLSPQATTQQVDSYALLHQGSPLIWFSASLNLSQLNPAS